METNLKAYPLVSICIPTYNGEAYIAEALASAITQTYPNLEIVVSDDASSDATLDVITSFRSKTQIPIHIHHHEPNGIGANWNHCVKMSSGSYIKFLFQDDVLLPECIAKMMEMAMKQPAVGMVYCRRSFLYDEFTPKLEEFMAYYGELHTYWHDLDVTEGILSGRDYLIDKQLLNSPKNKIGEPSNVLLHRNCFETVGYFSETLEQALDSDYWYRVMTKYDIGFVDDRLVKFRLHDQQASVINKKRELPDKALIYKRYYQHLYKYLHPDNKLKLLKLYHPFFKTLVTIKRYFYA